MGEDNGQYSSGRQSTKRHSYLAVTSRFMCIKPQVNTSTQHPRGQRSGGAQRTPPNRGELPSFPEGSFLQPHHQLQGHRVEPYITPIRFNSLVRAPEEGQRGGYDGILIHDVRVLVHPW